MLGTMLALQHMRKCILNKVYALFVMWCDYMFVVQSHLAMVVMFGSCCVLVKQKSDGDT